jgi:hypothetical protein
LKKTTINYRAVLFAAASFIALIIFIALPAKRKDTTGKVVAKPTGQILVKKETPKPNNNILSDNSVQVQKSSAQNHTKQTPTNKFSSDQSSAQAIVKTQEINIIKEEEKLQEEIKTEPIITAVVKPKRKFPIAHVNELNPVIPVDRDEPVNRSKTSFAFRKQTYEVPAPVAGFEEGFAERKQKSIFPLLNSSQ